MTTTMPAGEFSLPDSAQGPVRRGELGHPPVRPMATSTSWCITSDARTPRYMAAGCTSCRGRARSQITGRSRTLLIAFDVDSSLYYRSNGYVISEQGKPPDFVLEVASASTATPKTLG